MDKNSNSSRQTARILKLLKMFNDGQTVDINELKNEYEWDGVSERTIQRDLAIVKEYFPNSFSHVARSSKYKANTDAMMGNLNPKILTVLAVAYALSGKDMLAGLDEEVANMVKAHAKDFAKCYKLDVKPLEIVSGEMKIIENAVRLSKKLRVLYKPLSERKIAVKPYKILLMNENFYLACESEGGRFSTLRISEIKSIESTGEKFNKNKEIADFIESIQTAYSDYERRDKRVKITLEARAEVAKYFTDKKKFLSSQKIERELANGGKIVSYEVTNLREITPFVLKWLPNLKVIAPDALKTEISNILSEYQKELQ